MPDKVVSMALGRSDVTITLVPFKETYLRYIGKTECYQTILIFILNVKYLTHWGWVTHKCVSKLTNIGSDKSLSPGRRQAIILTKLEYC